MALTVGTDTYCARADADTYHANLPHNAAWRGVTPEQRDRLLRLATRLLDDHFTWHGIPHDLDQPLAWPRDGLLTRQGGWVDDETIPDIIRDATAELALALIANRTEDQTLKTLDIQRAGDVQFGGAARRKPIPDVVVDMIPPEWGEPRSSAGRSVGAIPLTRG